MPQHDVWGLQKWSRRASWRSRETPTNGRSVAFAPLCHSVLAVSPEAEGADYRMEATSERPAASARGSVRTA
jgi:hypothetical protein